MSRYTIIYFSPTGNVLHLARMLADHLGSHNTNVLPLEFVDQDKLEKGDHLILMYPVHGFNAPRNVKLFVEKLNPGIYDFVSLLTVGCVDSWHNGAVSFSMHKDLVNKNYSIVLDEILAMPLTFIMAFNDEVSNKVITASEQRIEGIARAITEGRRTLIDVKFKSHVLNFIGKIETPAARLFGLELHANNNCVSCGTCWDNCPANNIKENTKGKPKFGFSCMMCMRCIYNCPEKAISPRISKFIPIKKGYSLKQYRP